MRVISNTAISLDGRINTRDDLPPALGSPHDLRRMRQIRAQADAVLDVGVPRVVHQVGVPVKLPVDPW